MTHMQPFTPLSPFEFPIFKFIIQIHINEHILNIKSFKEFLSVNSSFFFFKLFSTKKTIDFQFVIQKYKFKIRIFYIQALKTSSKPISNSTNLKTLHLIVVARKFKLSTKMCFRYPIYKCFKNYFVFLFYNS